MLLLQLDLYQCIFSRIGIDHIMFNTLLADGGCQLRVTALASG